MAKRNRRQRDSGFVAALPWMAFLAGTVFLMLMYIWLDGRGQALGNRIKALERQLAELQQRYDLELSKWEALKSPPSIEQALARNRIAMIWPAEQNLVRLQDPDWVAGGGRPSGADLAQAPAPPGSVMHD